MHRDETLLVNEAFYLAFSQGDLTAMDGLWARRDDVVCIHPGWPALTNRKLVMESWARILGNPDQPKVAVHPIETVDLGNAMLVVCYEQMGGTVMVASNVFAAGPKGPRMVAHQAGLCSDPPELPTLPAPSFHA